MDELQKLAQLDIKIGQLNEQVEDKEETIEQMGLDYEAMELEKNTEIDKLNKKITAQAQEITKLVAKLKGEKKSIIDLILELFSR